MKSSQNDETHVHHDIHHNSRYQMPYRKPGPSGSMIPAFSSIENCVLLKPVLKERRDELRDVALLLFFHVQNQ
jgi:hypothetical protein